MRYGVDVGSTYTKIIALDNEGRIVDRCVLNTLIEHDKRVAEYLDGKSVYSITATGYGRNLIKDALGAKVISEIQAHARGACHFFSDCSLVIDLGGQDSKVIQVENGAFTDFRMNDKCAAGTGKFLEIAANRLGMSIDEFGQKCSEFDKEIEINSMCAVFAESELISLIAKKESTINIGAGVHISIASRLASMAGKFSMGSRVVFTGGGALNPLLKRLLEENLNVKIYTPNEPQMVGAIGAAIS